MKKNMLSKVLSTLLALVMVLGMLPMGAMSAYADDVPEMLVTSLTELYSGDETRAREDLEALSAAGLLDENGNMVALDIREDGERVELTALAERIAQGETVGAITVNGNAAEAEQIVKISQVNAAIEIAALLNEEIDVTDEHVENLESLLTGIADGSIDLESALRNGSLRLNANGGTSLRGTGDEDLPENTGTGEVDATDGKYTAPYISGSNYEASHSFTLVDSENTTWYTDSITPDGVVTITCEDTASVNKSFTVTATLDKTPAIPVSFDWTAISDIIVFTGETSGTVTWAANDTQLSKTFQITLGAKSKNWVGTQCFVINCANIQNAAFDGDKAVCSKTVQVAANDKIPVSLEYPNKTTELTSFTRGTAMYYDSASYSNVNYSMHYVKTKDAFPTSGRFTVSISGSSPKNVYLVDPNVDVESNLWGIMAGNQTQTTFNSGWSGYKDKDGVSWHAFDQTWFTDGKTSGQDSLAGTVKNGEVWLVIRNQAGYDSVNKVLVSIPQIGEHVKVDSISAPAGTYYTGQMIPVTVTFETPTIATAGTMLTVNGVDCPMLTAAGTESKYFTFGYTVKDTDSGALNVTALSNTLKNAYDNAVSLEGEFPTTQIGSDKGVILSSDVKVSSLDWENVKYGIDDANPGEQTVTVVIPFKSGANKTWVTNETIEINPALSMQIPDFEGAAVGGYLKSAYFSTDIGATRYPVYVIGENVDALAVRLAPAINASSFLRKDTLSLYLDTEVGTGTNYLGDWADKQVDEKGFAYFGATDSTANAAIGMRVSYYVKASIVFSATETIARPNYNEANIMKNASDAPNGFYKEGSEYVVVQGEDYDKQHDVELVANEALYNAVLNGVRAEDPNTLVLRYQISSRRNDFTFTDPKYFTWRSSNEQIATVAKDEQTGEGQIALMGGSGSVTITLTVIGNGKEYDIALTFTVLGGMTPFLNIPAFSRERTTLTDTDTDVTFTSNVTARNAEAGTNSTTFTAKLYSVSAVNDAPTGEPVWTESYTSTTKATVTHITVPGEQLPDAGVYAAVISTEYMGGKVEGVATEAQELSATAYLTVKQAPIKVKLQQLESYSIDYNDLDNTQFGYILTPHSANAVVQYTIQKSGEAVGPRTTVTGGAISVNAAKPTGLKEAYTITVYARSADAEETDPWSMDSMVLRVYNMEVLELIVKDVVRGEIGGTTGGVGDNANGTTVTMDNHDKLADYGISGDSYQLTVSDLDALRTDMSLQKIISANYGTGVWGLLSDKMQWTSSDSNLVSVNYEQGGFYADINNYSYTSYGPATDFLLVGKDDTDGVTITATHAGTGTSATVTVASNTLNDQLYVFQFYPKVVTDVVYTNGADVQRELKSDANGVLAVYEPQGIKSAVMVMSEKDGETYVGTIFKSELQSGERDIAALQLYPCNNLRLRSISNATLTFLSPDGSIYNGTVTVRAGVYKNGIYCPAAKSFLPASPDVKYSAQDDVTVAVSDGKLTLGFDPTSFKNDPNNAEETGAYAADKITYVIEYRVAGYQTSYAMLNVYTDAEGEQQPMDSVIQLKTVKGSADLPQITRQTIRQYSGDEPVAYTRDVIDYTGDIGISRKYDKVVLTTDFILPSSCVTVDAQGHTTLRGDFALFTADGRKLTGQTDFSKGADPIYNLSDLEGSELVVFPFSSSPIGHHVYTMTDANMKADGITDEGSNPTTSARIRAAFVRDGMTITNTSLPFGVSNLSHQKDLSQTGGGAKEIGVEVKQNLAETTDIGAIFRSINVNDMIRKGFVFLGNLSGAGADSPINLMILPTADPALFRIVAFVGANQRPTDDEDEGVSVNFNSEDLAEDMSKFMEEMEDDGDDDDGDSSGEGSLQFNFYGTIILEARIGVAGGDWDIAFRGGNVGANVKGKYEWGQTFFCGPYPAFISFEVGFHADLEVAFGNKSAVRAMLLDAALGVSVEAFAGLGFDLSIVAIQLGIYGTIGADVNFLLLTPNNAPVQTGTKLTISGEIGIKLKVKLLFISYTQKFASTGFNWTKKWNNYDQIKQYWTDQGFGQLFGTTRSGRDYTMYLFEDGSTIIEIEGRAEIENRDYLELAERAWNGGVNRTRRAVSMTDIQTNAYPYSHPAFTDDGEMFLYVSDNNNANEMQSVTSYAVKSGDGYVDMGRVDVSEENILADLDVVASGTKDNAFAVWTKQMESPEKEMHDEATYDDLGMMMNATEIYAGAYKDNAWTTARLTDNYVADMSPTVASSGNKAIVAWRSMNASSMPEDAEVITLLSEDFSDGKIPSGWSTSWRVGGWNGYKLLNDMSTDSAVLPVLDLRSYNHPCLSFRYTNQPSGKGTSVLKVQYSEDGGSTWIDIKDCSTSIDWATVNIELPSKNIQIRFYATKSADGYGALSIDDVVVSGADPYAVNMANDLTSMFNVENNINYRVYDNGTWKTAQVAYNGTAGTVNAIDSAMLADGTAILVYTVRTGEDVTTTETFYTVIGTDGNAVTTGRLTNDNYTDTNAQVTAVNENGGYFVLGWYSEHDAGEGKNADGNAVVAHDIRLARINANGSYDIDFPESIGGTGEKGVTSDFRFSAPANNADLTNVSIVWSQRMDSDEADDAGKYELNAIRFFRADGVTGLTAPTNIATTDKNYTIDHFDAYTDASGAIHAIILGSDYSVIEGIGVYDSIDLDAAAGNTVTNNSDSPQNLEILDGEAISSMKLAVGTFPTTAADVTADINIREVIPGLTMPVQFTVTNTGTGTLNAVTATVGTQSKEFTGLNLLPNQSATLILSYELPEGAVSDPDYSVTSNGTELGSGTLKLNRPDVGISGMKLLREENGERDIQVRLSNASDIPLAGSGKTVKLALYKDPFHENRIGEEISISGDALADIDAGTYTTVQTLNVTDIAALVNGEIPDAGLTVYARAWVEGTEEPNVYNNDNFVSFTGLLARNNGVKLTTDTALEESDGSYTVYADIRNNSMQDTNVGTFAAAILDSSGNVIAQKPFQAEPLSLTKEQSSSLYVDFAAADLNGKTPARAIVGTVYTVTFNLNGGTSTEPIGPVTTDLEGHITLPATVPTPPTGAEPLFFAGWYTAATDGDPITADYTFTENTTVFAHYVTHQHDYTYTADGATITAECTADSCTLPEVDGKHVATLTITAPTLTVYGGTGDAEATVANGIDGVDTPIVVYTCGTTVLDAAPTDAGTYKASITLGTGENSATAYVEYTIAKAEPAAPTGTATYGQTLADVELPEGWTWVDSTQSVGSVGSNTFKANFAGNNNYNAASNVDVTVTVNKANNPATVEGAPEVPKGGHTVDLAEYVTLNGATGEVSYAISGNAYGCSMSGSVLTSGNTGDVTVTVNVTVATDDNYLALAATPITVTILNQIEQHITASDVTAIYGETGVAISASTDGDGALSYEVTSGDAVTVDNAGNLTIVHAGTAVVTVSAAETGLYLPATTTVNVTINKATPAAADFTYTAPESLTYDGSAKAATVVPALNVTGMGEVTVHYYSDEARTTEVQNPTNAGTYYVGVTVAEGDNYEAITERIFDDAWTFTITKATPAAADFAFTAPESLTYDGSAKAATVVPALNVTGMGEITVHYYSDEQRTTEVLAANVVNAGTYYVGITVAEGDNYAAITERIFDAEWTFTITKATPTAADFTYTAPESLTYDGSAKAATVAATDSEAGMGEVTVHYYSDEQRTTEVQNPTNAGTYYVGITVAEGDNYAAITERIFDAAWTFTITKATPELTNVSATAITYGDKLSDSTVTGTATNPNNSANVAGTWAFTNGDAEPTVADSDTTEYEVTFTPTDGDNYENATVMITLTVNKAVPTYTAPQPKAIPYTGEPEELVVAGSTEDGTMLYSLDGENFAEEIPTATDFGTYDVWYKVEGDENHSDTEPVKLTSMIAMTIAGADTESALITFVENGERLYRYDVCIQNIPEDFQTVGLQVFLTFDADVLTFKRIESDDIEWVFSEKDGTLMLVWASDTEMALEEGQVLFSVIFAAPDCEAGTETVLPFTVNVLNTTSSVAILVDGNAVNYEAITADGCIRFSVPLLGDANCDGVVTAADAALVLRAVVGLSELSAYGAFNADVDGDLVITAADAALILRYVVGLITAFPIEEQD